MQSNTAATPSWSERLPFWMNPFAWLGMTQTSLKEKRNIEEEKQAAFESVLNSLQSWHRAAGLGDAPTTVNDTYWDAANNKPTPDQLREFLIANVALLNALARETIDDERCLDATVPNTNLFFLDAYRQRLDRFTQIYFPHARLADYAITEELYADQQETPVVEGVIPKDDDIYALDHKENFERYTSKRDNYILYGRVMAFVVAVGCGFISYNATLSFSAPVALLFGFSGFMTNLFLYVNSIVATVQNLFVQKHQLHNGVDKLTHSSIRKGLIDLSFLFACAAGLAFSALTCMSVMNALTGVVGLTYVYLTVSVIGVCMVVGMTSMMYNTTASLIKSEGSSVMSLLKAWFYPDRHMTWYSWRHLAKVAIMGACLAVGLAIGSLAGLTLCAVMQENLAGLLIGLGLGVKPALFSSIFVAWCMNGLLRFTFSIKNNMVFWSMLGNGVKESALYPSESMARVKHFFHKATHSGYAMFMSLCKMVMASLVVINGGSQGYLAEHGQGANVMEHTTGFSTSVSRFLAFITGALSSTGINANNTKTTFDDFEKLSRVQDDPVFRDPTQLGDESREGSTRHILKAFFAHTPKRELPSTLAIPGASSIPNTPSSSPPPGPIVPPSTPSALGDPGLTECEGDDQVDPELSDVGMVGGGLVLPHPARIRRVNSASAAVSSGEGRPAVESPVFDVSLERDQKLQVGFRSSSPSSPSE